MKNSITESFSTILTLLHYFGLYRNKNATKIKQIFGFMLYFSSLMVVILTLSKLIVQESEDFMQTTHMIIFTADATAVCLKVLLILVYKSRIQKCIDYFGDHSFAPKNHEEIVITEDCVRVCKRTFRAFAIVIILVDVWWNIAPFFDKEYRLPLDIWLPYDPTSRPTVFYGTYFYVVLVLLCYGVMAFTLDPLGVGLVYHATGQIKILKYNLVNLIMEAIGNESYDSDVDHDHMTSMLKRCVLRHNKILRFIVEYENSFSWIIFIQMAANTIGLGFCCIGLTLVSLTSSYGLIFVGSYSVIIFQLLFYCHYGMLLYDENEGLLTAICTSSWYKYNTRIQKMLLIINERSKYPVVLSAGKLIKLNYETFISTLKTSYSFIALMNNVK